MRLAHRIFGACVVSSLTFPAAWFSGSGRFSSHSLKAFHAGRSALPGRCVAERSAPPCTDIPATAGGCAVTTGIEFRLLGLEVIL